MAFSFLWITMKHSGYRSTQHRADVSRRALGLREIMHNAGANSTFVRTLNALCLAS